MSLPPSVGVLGAGLIGASVGMALRAAGVDVLLADSDPHQVRLAEARGAGRPWPAGERVAHAVVAVPPHGVAAELHRLQQAGAADTYSDAASVKTAVVADAAALGVDPTTWCPAHPVAGRERGGAASALVDLFRERTWVLCPTAATGEDAVRAVRAVALACGAHPVDATPERHDAAMAVLSHLPQVTASLLAAAAPELGTGELALAGQGFRDMTRLADSDPDLWASILEGNRGPVAAAARRTAKELTGLADVLDVAGAPEVAAAVTQLVARGRTGRALLPQKAGQPARRWAWVGVVLDDRPGQLGDLFVAVGRWRVNVEDVAPFEHSQESPAGTVEIAVDPHVADDLRERLADSGWTAYRRS